MTKELVDTNIVESIRQVGTSRNKPQYYNQLVSMFTEQADQLLKEVEYAIEFQDPKLLRHCAHRLKGSAESIGACRFTESCLELQGLAELPNLNYEVAKEAFLDANAIYQETKAHIDRELSG